MRILLSNVRHVVSGMWNRRARIVCPLFGGEKMPRVLHLPLRKTGHNSTALYQSGTNTYLGFGEAPKPTAVFVRVCSDQRVSVLRYMFVHVCYHTALPSVKRDGCIIISRLYSLTFM